MTILATPEEQATLRQWHQESPEEWGTTSMEVEVLDHMTSDSELQWISPVDTGDMTAAPILGVWGETVAGKNSKEPCYGYVPCGHWDEKDWFLPILHRWAFMSYALRSFLDDLESDGRADFVGG